jgi:PTH2 family peptidyl-tRNA hydrolase
MGLFTREAGEYKLVIVMRSDLKMTKGKMAAQASHAAVACAFNYKKKDPKGFDRWDASGQKTVVVKVDTQAELFEIKAVADAQSMPNCVITDAGRTEVPEGSITCIGIGPGPEDQVDKVTGELSML